MRRLAITLVLFSGGLCLQGQGVTADLPDAPDAQPMMQGDAEMEQMMTNSGMTQAPPCTPTNTPPVKGQAKTAPGGKNGKPPCIPLFDPYEPFVNGQMITPMTVRQKGLLAVHNVINPFNLLTIGGTAAFDIGIDAHTAYGPGVRGWAKDAGYSLAQDVQGEGLGTFAITALTHEDPRYHRMPHAPIKKRVLHAILHTYVSQHDDGRPMPNYETLVGFPLCAELSDLYVPGIATNIKSTAARVAIAYAGNPGDDLITEFLPDVASHIHLRVVFVQRILNRVATGQTGVGP